jgi:hypothetical protein
MKTFFFFYTIIIQSTFSRIYIEREQKNCKMPLHTGIKNHFVLRDEVGAMSI